MGLRPGSREDSELSWTMDLESNLFSTLEDLTRQTCATMGDEGTSALFKANMNRASTALEAERKFAEQSAALRRSCERLLRQKEEREMQQSVMRASSLAKLTNRSIDIPEKISRCLSTGWDLAMEFLSSEDCITSPEFASSLEIVRRNITKEPALAFSEEEIPLRAALRVLDRLCERLGQMGGGEARTKGPLPDVAVLQNIGSLLLEMLTVRGCLGSALRTIEWLFECPEAVQIDAHDAIERLRAIPERDLYTSGHLRTAILTCGQNSYGELGVGDDIERHVFTKAHLPGYGDVVEVASGNELLLVRTKRGQVLSCGLNKNGQCGQGYICDKIPFLLPILAFRNMNVRRLITGNGCEHVIAVVDDGTSYSWGYNNRGQLGLGLSSARTSVPRRIDALKSKVVVAGGLSYHHSSVVTENGELYTFGANDSGQLGTGSTQQQNLPQIVLDALRGERVISSACGLHHTVICTAEGNIFSFGKNDFGQLGFSCSEGHSKTPKLVRLPDSRTPLSVACGYYHTTILCEDGSIFTFGRNDYGQLGVGHRAGEDAPQRVLLPGGEGEKIMSIACGSYHTVLLSTKGSVYTFGRNNKGQLGQRSIVDQPSPTHVEYRGSSYAYPSHLNSSDATTIRSPSVGGVRQISAGFYTTCILSTNDLTTEVNQAVEPFQTICGRAVIDESGEIEALSNFATVVGLGFCLGNRGRWYYEAEIVTGGLVQLGWVDDEFQGSSDGGQGVGDHTHSWSYDGSRQRRWNQSSFPYGERWKKGDVIGCLIDLNQGRISFSKNGNFLGTAFENVSSVCGANHPRKRLNFYPAVSLEQGEVVRLNTGQQRFMHCTELLPLWPLSDSTIPDPCYLAIEAESVLPECESGLLRFCSGLHEFASVTVAEDLLILGGEIQTLHEKGSSTFKSRKLTSQCWISRGGSGKWEKWARLPEPMKGHKAIVVENQVLVIGGETAGGNAARHMRVWSCKLSCDNTLLSNWEEVRVGGNRRDGGPIAMPAGRVQHAVAALRSRPDNAIFIYGGRGTDDMVMDDAWCFILSSGSWFLLPQSPPGSTLSPVAETSLPLRDRPGGRAGAAVAAVGECVFLVGGQAQCGTNYGDIWRYSLFDQTWQLLEDDFTHNMASHINDSLAVDENRYFGLCTDSKSSPTPRQERPCPRRFHAIDVCFGCLWMIGGVDDRGQEITDCWRYCLWTNEWTKVTERPNQERLKTESHERHEGGLIAMYGGPSLVSQDHSKCRELKTSVNSTLSLEFTSPSSAKLVSTSGIFNLHLSLRWQSHPFTPPPSNLPGSLEDNSTGRPAAAGELFRGSWYNEPWTILGVISEDESTKRRASILQIMEGQSKLVGLTLLAHIDRLSFAAATSDFTTGLLPSKVKHRTLCIHPSKETFQCLSDALRRRKIALERECAKLEKISGPIQDVKETYRRHLELPHFYPLCALLRLLRINIAEVVRLGLPAMEVLEHGATPERSTESQSENSAADLLADLRDCIFQLFHFSNRTSNIPQLAESLGALGAITLDIIRVGFSFLIPTFESRLDFICVCMEKARTDADCTGQASLVPVVLPLLLEECQFADLLNLNPERRRKKRSDTCSELSRGSTDPIQMGKRLSSDFGTLRRFCGNLFSRLRGDHGISSQNVAQQQRVRGMRELAIEFACLILVQKAVTSWICTETEEIRGTLRPVDSSLGTNPCSEMWEFCSYYVCGVIGLCESHLSSYISVCMLPTRKSSSTFASFAEFLDIDFDKLLAPTLLSILSMPADSNIFKEMMTSVWPKLSKILVMVETRLDTEDGQTHRKWATNGDSGKNGADKDTCILDSRKAGRQNLLSPQVFLSVPLQRVLCRYLSMDSILSIMPSSNAFRLILQAMQEAELCSDLTIAPHTSSSLPAEDGSVDGKAWVVLSISVGAEFQKVLRTRRISLKVRGRAVDMAESLTLKNVEAEDVVWTEANAYFSAHLRPIPRATSSRASLSKVLRIPDITGNGGVGGVKNLKELLLETLPEYIRPNTASMPFDGSLNSDLETSARSNSSLRASPAISQHFLWMDEVIERILRTGAHYASCLIEGDPESSLEQEVRDWLESSLFIAGVEGQSEPRSQQAEGQIEDQIKSYNSRLLEEILNDRGDGGRLLAAVVAAVEIASGANDPKRGRIRRMDSVERTLERGGGKKCVDEAVRATFACLLKHGAAAYVSPVGKVDMRGDEEHESLPALNVADSVIDTYRRALQIRLWIVQEQKKLMSNHANESISKDNLVSEGDSDEHNSYDGTSTLLYRAVCDSVIQRAKLLLKVAPTVADRVPENLRLFPLSDDDCANMLSTKQRALMLRRKSMEKLEREEEVAQNLIMRFLRHDLAFDIAKKVDAALATRSQRSRERLRGLEMFHQLLSVELSSPTLKLYLLHSFSSALSRSNRRSSQPSSGPVLQRPSTELVTIPRGNGEGSSNSSGNSMERQGMKCPVFPLDKGVTSFQRGHFLDLLGGCGTVERTKITSLFFKLAKDLICSAEKLLARIPTMDSEQALHAFEKILLVVKICTLPYRPEDSDHVEECGILRLLTRGLEWGQWETLLVAEKSLTGRPGKDACVRAGHVERAADGDGVHRSVVLPLPVTTVLRPACCTGYITVDHGGFSCPFTSYAIVAGDFDDQSEKLTNSLSVAQRWNSQLWQDPSAEKPETEHFQKLEELHQGLFIADVGILRGRWYWEISERAEGSDVAQGSGCREALFAGVAFPCVDVWHPFKSGTFGILHNFKVIDGQKIFDQKIEWLPGAILGLLLDADRNSLEVFADEVRLTKISLSRPASENCVFPAVLCPKGHIKIEFPPNVPFAVAAVTDTTSKEIQELVEQSVGITPRGFAESSLYLDTSQRSRSVVIFEDGITSMFFHVDDEEGPVEEIQMYAASVRSDSSLPTDCPSYFELYLLSCPMETAPQIRIGVVGETFSDWDDVLPDGCAFEVPNVDPSLGENGSKFGLLYNPLDLSMRLFQGGHLIETRTLRDTSLRSAAFAAASASTVGVVLRFNFQSPWPHDLPLSMSSNPLIGRPRSQGKIKLPDADLELTGDSVVSSLDMELVSTDGGDGGQEFACANILVDNDLVYSTDSSSNVHIVFRHKYNTPFVLTGITVRGPGQRYTAPVGDLCIFITSELMDEKVLAQFDDLTIPEFLALPHPATGCNVPRDTNQPLLYFHLTDGSASVSENFQRPIIGRFVTVKLLRPQAGRNIDIGHIKFWGLAYHGLDTEEGSHGMGYGREVKAGPAYSDGLHYNHTCCECFISPIEGVRYSIAGQEQHNLCPNCYDGERGDLHAVYTASISRVSVDGAVSEDSESFILSPRAIFLAQAVHALTQASVSRRETVASASVSRTSLRPGGCKVRRPSASFFTAAEKHLRDTDLFVCGQNNYGELGLGHNNVVSKLENMNLNNSDDIIHVGAGNESMVILDRAGKVLTVGFNKSGQGGHGTYEDKVLIPTEVKALLGIPITYVAAANGCEHMIAIAATGAAFSWGFNDRGQLGHGNVGAKIHTPRLIESLRGVLAVRAAVSYHHSLILSSLGEVFAFGMNDCGQLGLGHNQHQHTPQRIELLLPSSSGLGRIVSIACGLYHSLAITSKGRAFSFGKNDYGQLGLADLEASKTPTVIDLPTLPGDWQTEADSARALDIVDVACGYYHTVLVSVSGRAYTFGRNDYGQLGIGSKDHSKLPKVVPQPRESSIVSAACGCYHTLLLTDQGNVFAFGRNNKGQLGANARTLPTADLPIQIPNMSLGCKTAVHICAGFYSTYILTGTWDMAAMDKAAVSAEASALLTAAAEEAFDSAMRKQQERVQSLLQQNAAKKEKEMSFLSWSQRSTLNVLKAMWASYRVIAFSSCQSTQDILTADPALYAEEHDPGALTSLGRKALDGLLNLLFQSDQHCTNKPSEIREDLGEQSDSSMEWEKGLSTIGVGLISYLETTMLPFKADSLISRKTNRLYQEQILWTLLRCCQKCGSAARYIALHKDLQLILKRVLGSGISSSTLVVLRLLPYILKFVSPTDFSSIPTNSATRRRLGGWWINATGTPMFKEDESHLVSVLLHIVGGILMDCEDSASTRTSAEELTASIGAFAYIREMSVKRREITEERHLLASEAVAVLRTMALLPNWREKLNDCLSLVFKCCGPSIAILVRRSIEHMDRRESEMEDAAFHRLSMASISGFSSGRQDYQNLKEDDKSSQSRVRDKSDTLLSLPNSPATEAPVSEPTSWEIDPSIDNCQVEKEQNESPERTFPANVGIHKGGDEGRTTNNSRTQTDGSEICSFLQLRLALGAISVLGGFTETLRSGSTVILPEYLRRSKEDIVGEILQLDPSTAGLSTVATHRSNAASISMLQIPTTDLQAAPSIPSLPIMFDTDHNAISFLLRAMTFENEDKDGSGGTESGDLLTLQLCWRAAKTLASIMRHLPSTETLDDIIGPSTSNNSSIDDLYRQCIAIVVKIIKTFCTPNLVNWIASRKMFKLKGDNAIIGALEQRWHLLKLKQKQRQQDSKSLTLLHQEFLKMRKSVKSHADGMTDTAPYYSRKREVKTKMGPEESNIKAKESQGKQSLRRDTDVLFGKSVSSRTVAGGQEAAHSAAYRETQGRNLADSQHVWGVLTTLQSTDHAAVEGDPQFASKSVELSAPLVLIGRTNGSCDVVVNDRSVSGRHFHLRLLDHGGGTGSEGGASPRVELQDFSKNGTIVDGVRVHHACATISSGSQISLILSRGGLLTFEFQLLAEKRGTWDSASSHSDQHQNWQQSNNSSPRPVHMASCAANNDVSMEYGSNQRGQPGNGSGPQPNDSLSANARLRHRLGAHRNRLALNALVVDRSTGAMPRQALCSPNPAIDSPRLNGTTSDGGWQSCSPVRDNGSNALTATVQPLISRLTSTLLSASDTRGTSQCIRDATGRGQELHSSITLGTSHTALVEQVSAFVVRQKGIIPSEVWCEEALRVSGGDLQKAYQWMEDNLAALKRKDTGRKRLEMAETLSRMLDMSVEETKCIIEECDICDLDTIASAASLWILNNETVGVQPVRSSSAIHGPEEHALYPDDSAETISYCAREVGSVAGENQVLQLEASGLLVSGRQERTDVTVPEKGRVKSSASDPSFMTLSALKEEEMMVSRALSFFWAKCLLRNVLARCDANGSKVKSVDFGEILEVVRLVTMLPGSAISVDAWSEGTLSKNRLWKDALDASCADFVLHHSLELLTSAPNHRDQSIGDSACSMSSGSCEVQAAWTPLTVPVKLLSAMQHHLAQCEDDVAAKTHDSSHLESIMTFSLLQSVAGDMSKGEETAVLEKFIHSLLQHLLLLSMRSDGGSISLSSGLEVMPVVSHKRIGNLPPENALLAAQWRWERKQIESDDVSMPLFRLGCLDAPILSIWRACMPDSHTQSGDWYPVSDLIIPDPTAQKNLINQSSTVATQPRQLNLLVRDDGSGMLAPPLKFERVDLSPTVTDPFNPEAAVYADNVNGSCAYIWWPVAPEGYVATGAFAVGRSYGTDDSISPPPLNSVRCIRRDVAEVLPPRRRLWGAHVIRHRTDWIGLHSSGLNMPACYGIERRPLNNHRTTLGPLSATVALTFEDSLLCGVMGNEHEGIISLLRVLMNVCGEIEHGNHDSTAAAAFIRKLLPTKLVNALSFICYKLTVAKTKAFGDEYCIRLIRLFNQVVKVSDSKDLVTLPAIVALRDLVISRYSKHWIRKANPKRQGVCKPKQLDKALIELVTTLESIMMKNVQPTAETVSEGSLNKPLSWTRIGNEKFRFVPISNVQVSNSPREEQVSLQANLQGTEFTLDIPRNLISVEWKYSKEKGQSFQTVNSRFLYTEVVVEDADIHATNFHCELVFKDPWRRDVETGSRSGGVFSGSVGLDIFPVLRRIDTIKGVSWPVVFEGRNIRPGDVIGCGIHLNRGEVFATVNGAFAGTMHSGLPQNLASKSVPILSLKGSGAVKLKVKVAPELFSFKLLHHDWATLLGGSPLLDDHLEVIETLRNLSKGLSRRQFSDSFILNADSFISNVCPEACGEVSSPHPYRSLLDEGELDFHRATSLRILLDSRCDILPVHCLQIQGNAHNLPAEQIGYMDDAEVPSFTGRCGDQETTLLGTTTHWRFPIKASFCCRIDRNRRGDAVQLDNSDARMSIIKDKTWQTAIGLSRFDNGVHTWEVKVNSVTSSANIFLGVAKKDVRLDSYLGKDHRGWGWIGNCALWHNGSKQRSGFGEKLKSDDVVKLTLDLFVGTLSYEINGKAAGVAFGPGGLGPALEPPLYPAFALYNSRDSIELIRGSRVDGNSGIKNQEIPNSPARMRNAEELSALGFPLEWCLYALRVCQDDMDRAVDFILTNNDTIGIMAAKDDEERRNREVAIPGRERTEHGGNKTESWGIAFTVMPQYPLFVRRRMEQESRERLEKFRIDTAPDCSWHMDVAIATLTNCICDTLPSSSSDCDSLSLRPPDLWAQIADLKRLVSSQPISSSELLKLEALARWERKFLASRFILLRNLNRRIHNILDDVDFSVKDEFSDMTHLLRQNRALIFKDVKMRWLDNILSEQETSVSLRPEIEIDRRASVEIQQKVETENYQCIDSKDWSKSVFGQCFNQLGHLTPSLLRGKERSFKCQFLGEFGDDFGGLYRECLAEISSELQSAVLPLFVPSHNTRKGVGNLQGVFVPDATATKHSSVLPMFEFVGKLMGMAIRSKNPLDLNLSSIVWKPLVGLPVTREDIEDIHDGCFELVDTIENAELQGMTDEMFDDLFDETFTVLTCSGERVSLLPGGERVRVKWQNKDRYATLAKNFKLNEFKRATDAICAGMSTVIPLAPLSILTWQELQYLVCGHHEVDLELLKKRTVYGEGCQPTDPHIGYFWKTLESYSGQQKSMFLRFVWGRSRLPAKASEFVQDFKISVARPSRPSSSPDEYLPVAHTCFFSLDLPQYSSEEILRDKLTYAITHCQAIDADDTQVARRAAQAGSDIMNP